MQEHEIWDRRRIKLEEELVKAALDLCGHMGGTFSAGMIPVPNTAPKLYIHIGEMKNDKD